MIHTDKYKDKNIIIYGLGKTGISTYQALKESCANIFIWDDDDSVRQELSKSGMEVIRDYSRIKTTWINTSKQIMGDPFIIR